MRRYYLAGILIVIVMLAIGAATYVLMRPSSQENGEQKLYSYKVVNVYPHNTSAFTQGLVFSGGFLYEGTGIWGESKLGKVELVNGHEVQSFSLSSEYFGEGITIFGDKIIQLTWLDRKGFVYEKDSFNLIQTFDYNTEGWGITTDGQKLIMSDGTATLYFLDPDSYQIIGSVAVYDSSGPVTRINELEYVNGLIYANIWEQKRIAIINIQTGEVEGWADLNGLEDPNESANQNNVLNGIAYDSNGDRLFVTGKRWTQLFEIELVLIQ